MFEHEIVGYTIVGVLSALWGGVTLAQSVLSGCGFSTTVFLWTAAVYCAGLCWAFVAWRRREHRVRSGRAAISARAPSLDEHEGEVRRDHPATLLVAVAGLAAMGCALDSGGRYGAVLAVLLAPLCSVGAAVRLLCPAENGAAPPPPVPRSEAEDQREQELRVMLPSREMPDEVVVDDGDAATYAFPVRGPDRALPAADESLPSTSVWSSSSSAVSPVPLRPCPPACAAPLVVLATAAAGALMLGAWARPVRLTPDPCEVWLEYVPGPSAAAQWINDTSHHFAPIQQAFAVPLRGAPMVVFGLPPFTCDLSGGGYDAEVVASWELVTRARWRQPLASAELRVIPASAPPCAQNRTRVLQPRVTCLTSCDAALARPLTWHVHTDCTSALHGASSSDEGANETSLLRVVGARFDCGRTEGGSDHYGFDGELLPWSCFVVELVILWCLYCTGPEAPRQV